MWENEGSRVIVYYSNVELNPDKYYIWGLISFAFNLKFSKHRLLLKTMYGE